MDLDASRLAPLIEFAEACRTDQLVVIQGGKWLVDEVWHADAVDVFAVQKGILAILLGMAEEKGLIDIPDPVNHHLDPEWTGLSPWKEASLTIEILLQMTTGMDDHLQPLGTVGETWRYNNTAYNYLKKILMAHTGLSLNQLSRSWLFDGLGMEHTCWIPRPQTLPDGTPFTGLESTASDLARIGLMVLNRGVQDGARYVPDHFLDDMIKPGSAENPAWGYCWWNNRSDHHRVPMREDTVRQGNFLTTAPRSLIAARGLFENYLYVVPEWSMVVARTARQKSSGSEPVRFERTFWELLTKAVMENID